jgi:undecaprenyl-diphosphatase
MSPLNVIILAIVQGLAELLPVSSSAHVVVTEKLMGLDPSSPPMTLLLVMLHTGTMVAVIVYFWRQWRSAYFQSMAAFKDAAKDIVAASALTAVIGGALIEIIEKTAFHGAKGAQVEDLFSHLEIIAPALALGGLLILAAAIFSNRSPAGGSKESPRMSLSQAAWIGAVQGLCLPFRGFSRSGATISTGMLTGVGRREAEAFSFALAVVLTPAAIAREAMRLVHVSTADGAGNHLTSTVTLSLLGAVIAFLAGLVALKWLSRWLEGGRWHLFGIYCLAAAAIVFALHLYGY